jgi:hypothetical protein
MAWQQSGGTIFCDGRVRGSATMLSTDPGAAGVPGHFIATAAHVLWNLERGVPFEHCEFHFLGLSQLPGYRARIDERWVRAGAFDPGRDPASVGFGDGDWAFVYLPSGLGFTGRRGGLRVPEADEPIVPSAEGVRIVAWNRDLRRVTVSGPCRYLHSKPGDLGGGAWAGQLLDDCDSADGASGGALFLQQGDGAILVGIRSGAHWDGDRYPQGPPAGAPWDVRANTNFARALTPELIAAFRGLQEEVVATHGVSPDRRDSLSSP